MFRIGLLSDTHGYFDPRIADHFGECDEIWHAGDIGDPVVADRLEEIAPLVAVYGNIDGTAIRARFPGHQRLHRESLDIWMTHIGGYPGHYAPAVKPAIYHDPPGLFISGHSHILKIMPDKKLGLLHMNPGAAGRSGMHLVRTMIRFGIEKGRVGDVDVIELGPRTPV
jgi:putative phosphoesterase